MIKKILIVDDSAMIRRIVSQLVQQLGHLAVVAKNGQQGWEMAISTNPDLVIMDIEMPEMDGFESARRIKTDPRTAAIPVVFFTALTSEEHLVHAKEVGGNGFLNKPICEEELSKAINDILSSNRPRR